MGEIAPGKLHIVNLENNITNLFLAHLRGRMVGIFGACFQIGSLGMNGAMLGFAKVKNDWGWRVPLLLEGLFPALVCITIYLISPESPRYLIMRGQKEKAKKVVARFQTTEGTNLDHPLVTAVISQIEESLEENAHGHRQFW